ncbi:MAG: FtsX-like permease family protein, partial [Longimicrobiales bacterium]
AYVGVDALIALAGDRLPRADGIAVDATVLAFALVLSLLTGLIAGALPAWRAADANVQSVLREGGRTGTDGPARGRLRNGLVIAETALAVVLVIGATLMVRNFARLTAVDPGFSPERVVSFGVTMQSELFDGDPETVTARREAYRTRMFTALRELPGVIAVGGSKTMPLAAGGEPYAFSSSRGGESDLQPEGGVMIVTPEYFHALGVPLLAGRVFTERDAPPNDFAMIVNQAFVQQYWPGSDAVGRYVYMGEEPIAIVGVITDIRHDGVASTPRATMYLPSPFAPRSSQKVFVRTTAAPTIMIATVRDAMQRFDPELPITDLATLPSVVAESIAQPRMLTTLLGLFGAIALLLAALGMYGVIAYGVAQRTQEIGIRMALGARPGRVVRMVVGQAVALAAAGIALGLLAAFWLTRVLRSILFEVSTTDPLTFAFVPLILLVVAACAALLPAWRASRVDMNQLVNA